MHQPKKKQLEEAIRQIRKQIDDLQEQLLSYNRYTGDEWINTRQQQEKDTHEKELARLRTLLSEHETEMSKLDQDNPE